jgi:hypothetical protein
MKLTDEDLMLLKLHNFEPVEYGFNEYWMLNGESKLGMLKDCDKIGTEPYWDKLYDTPGWKSVEDSRKEYISYYLYSTKESLEICGRSFEESE